MRRRCGPLQFLKPQELLSGHQWQRAVKELCMSEGHWCFSLWNQKGVAAETAGGSSRKRPTRTTCQTRVLLPVFTEHTIESGLVFLHSTVATASSHFRCWLVYQCCFSSWLTWVLTTQLLMLPLQKKKGKICSPLVCKNKSIWFHLIDYSERVALSELLIWIWSDCGIDFWMPLLWLQWSL